MTLRPRLIIFDCDGVLVDSESLAAENLRAELTAIGFSGATSDYLARLRGRTMAEAMRMVEADWGRTLPDDFLARLRARDVGTFESHLKAVAGVPEILDRLPVPVCVASSGSPEKIRHSLGLTGLLERFEPHLFSAASVARGKPAPDLFLLAARTMGSAPANCAVIEDSVPGIVAAVAAGMHPLGFVGASHGGETLGTALAQAGAARVFRDMRDLPELLGFA